METIVEVGDQSSVGEVRRVVADIGTAAHLAPHDLARAALAATELGTNLVKYAKHGTVVVSRFVEHGVHGLQLVSVDKGPGFADFGASARDGHSTGGSLGVGLGTIQRAADLFQVYSRPGQGSVLLVRITRDAAAIPSVPGRLQLGVRRAPKAGQTESGDAWSYCDAGGPKTVCVVDGLGHGPMAAIASHAAIRVFREAGPAASPEQILVAAHAALRTTRGAVMAVVAIDPEHGSATFCGVGNVAGIIHTPGRQQHLVSTDGIVGFGTRAFRTREHDWPPGSTLILTSDGISTRWNLDRYPDLLKCHPALIASVVFRDHARDTDDATVVVARVAA